MKKILLFTVLCLSQICYPNDSTQISILTCAPGQEVYAIFGHTSIRVVDSKSQTDIVYNFGMFDFDTPNFSYKFLKGKLKYYLGIQKTKDFIKDYTYENRTVTEQVLYLNETEKEEIVNRLQFLYRPENRFYFYSFLHKNCSTEIRDILEHIGVKFRKQQLNVSHRQMITSYLKSNPWLRLGINMILGNSMDQAVNSYEAMFLPNDLMKEIAVSSKNDSEIVKSTRDLNSVSIRNPTRTGKIISPLLLFSIFAIISIFWFPKPLKSGYCFSIGIIGLLITFLLVFSEHPEVKNNFNILWCNPLYLLYFVFIAKKKVRSILALVLSTSLLISIVIWIFKIQVFDISIIPLIIILGFINYSELKTNWRAFDLKT